MKMLLDGNWVSAQDGSVMEILNPSDQSVLGEVPAATRTDVDNAVAAAVLAKPKMAAMPAHRRAEILEAVSARITQNRDHLIKLLVAENGKTFREIDGWEIDAAARIIKGYAEEAKRLFGHAIPLNGIPNLENSLAMTLYQPKGVIAAIIPFNYPVELWSHKIAGGLAAGNCVITKAPEECPLAMLEISRYYEEAGLPPGAHQILTGYGEVVGARLAEIDGVDMISMTGSTEVGRLVSAAAAKTLKKVHLELGGSDATIICADVDPQIAAEALVAGRFTSGNGQICCAVKRVFVDKAIHQDVVDHIVALTENLKVGDHTQRDTDVGPMISQRAADGVKTQIDQAVAEGATLLTGGTQSGQHIHPAVFVDVPENSTLLHEEVFGPVLPILPFDGIDDAIAQVNNSAYGLQASIFTNDFRAIMNAGLKLEVGTVIVNHQTAMRIECLPFGGRKLSGNGVREGLMETLKDFSETKTIVLKDAFNVFESV